MVKSCMLGIGVVAAILVLTISVASAGEENSNNPRERQRQMDERLASQLQGLLVCKSLAGIGDGNVYCNLKYRGMEMEFAGANAPGGGTIYVKSLGRNQTLSVKGRRCIEIEFKDKDLRNEGFTMGAIILFRDDATITYNLNNQKAWKECG